jgi:hypothetical protein
VIADINNELAKKAAAAANPLDACFDSPAFEYKSSSKAIAKTNQQRFKIF